MTILTTKLIKEAREKHPEAMSEVEALDLYGQDIYKELQTDNSNQNFHEDNKEKIELYHTIYSIRDKELDRLVDEISNYKIKERTQNEIRIDN